MQDLLTPITIGNEQYYPRNAVDAVLKELNTTIDSKTVENAHMVVRNSELCKSYDRLLKAHTDLELRHDDLYRDWVDAVEISRKAIEEANRLRKQAGQELPEVNYG